MLICRGCGLLFEPHDSRQVYHDRPCQHRTKVNRSQKTEKGKARLRRAEKRYDATSKGKAKYQRYAQTTKFKQQQRRYTRSHLGKATRSAWQQTEKGRLSRIAAKARRRCRAPEEYIRWFERLIFKEKRSCVYCGGRERLQLDHIIPLSLGGVDDPSNYQVLCDRHHRCKTGRDVSLLSKVRKGVISPEDLHMILASRDVLGCLTSDKAYAILYPQS